MEKADNPTLPAVIVSVPEESKIEPPLGLGTPGLVDVKLPVPATIKTVPAPIAMLAPI